MGMFFDFCCRSMHPVMTTTLCLYPRPSRLWLLLPHQRNLSANLLQRPPCLGMMMTTCLPSPSLLHRPNQQLYLRLSRQRLQSRLPNQPRAYSGRLIYLMACVPSCCVLVCVWRGDLFVIDLCGGIPHSWRIDFFCSTSTLTGMTTMICSPNLLHPNQRRRPSRQLLPLNHPLLHPTCLMTVMPVRRHQSRLQPNP